MVRAKSAKRLHNVGVAIHRGGVALIALGLAVTIAVPAVLMILHGDGDRELTPFEEHLWLGSIGAIMLGFVVAGAGAALAHWTHRRHRWRP